MKSMVQTLMLIHLVAILVAEEDDASHRFTIEGQYIAVEKTSNEREIRDNHLNLSNIKVVVSRQISGEDGEIDSDTLALGSFEEGQVSLEFDLNQFTEAQISIIDGEDVILSTGRMDRTGRREHCVRAIRQNCLRLRPITLRRNL